MSIKSSSFIFRNCYYPFTFRYSNCIFTNILLDNLGLDVENMIIYIFFTDVEV